LHADIILLAANCRDGVIGRGNALPCGFKSDMQHFRALTMGKPVVMGRKTYLSIGRPLKGRTTIVVSRDRDFTAPGIVVAPSLGRRGWRRRAATRLRKNAIPSLLPAAPKSMPKPCRSRRNSPSTRVHKHVDGDRISGHRCQ